MTAGGDFEQVLAGIKPKTRTVRVCLDGDLLAEHARLEQSLFEERRMDVIESREHDQTSPQVARQIQEIEQRIADSAVEFTFTAIGQKAWTDLLAEHPPETDDREEGYQFNPRTFPQAAIARCSVGHTISLAQVERLFAVLNYGQWQTLWQACLAANVEAADVPFSSAASVVLHGSEMKSGRPASSELPVASSSGE